MTPVLSSAGRPVRGSTAVVFVHGFASSPAIWSEGDGTPLTEQAAALPGITAWTFDYSRAALYWVTDPRIGPRLATAIDCLAALTGHRVIVVAHSMGGLATQDALGAAASSSSTTAAHVAGVITIGTPFLGSAIEAGLVEAAGDNEKRPALPEFVFDVWRTECARRQMAGEQPPCWNFGLEKTPAGLGLMYRSPQILALPPWPTSVPDYAAAGKIEEVVSVGDRSVRANVGDGIVGVDSALAAATTGGTFVSTCRNVALTQIFDSDDVPCYHHNLPHNPQIVAQTLAWIQQLAAPGPGGHVSGTLVRTYTQPLAQDNDNGPLAISPGDHYLAAGGTHTALWPLSASTGTLLTDPTYPGHPISDPAFNADGSVLVTTGYQDRAWDTSTGHLLEPGFPPPSAAVNIGGSGDVLIAPPGNASNTFTLYSPGTAGVSQLITHTLSGSSLTRSAVHRLHTQFALDSQGFTPAIDPSGSVVLGAGTGGRHLPVRVRIATGTVLPFPAGQGPLPGATQARFSPDGSYLAAAYANSGQTGTIVYDTATWRKLASFPGQSFAFSPDSKTLALGSSSGPGVRFYSVDGGRELGSIATAGEIAGHDRAITFSQDGRYLAVAINFHGIELWRLTSG